MESFSPVYKHARDFLIAIAEVSSLASAHVLTMKIRITGTLHVEEVRSLFYCYYKLHGLILVMIGVIAKISMR